MHRVFLPALLALACAPGPTPTPDAGPAPDAGTPSAPDAVPPSCTVSAISPTDEWTRCLGQWSQAQGVSVDADGNIYVAAQLDEPLDLAGAHLVPTKASDPLLVKYSPQGELLWAKQVVTLGGLAAPQADGVPAEGMDRVTVLADGSVMVAGRFGYAADFGEGLTLQGNPNETTAPVMGYDVNDGFLARYAADGHVLWAKLIGAHHAQERFDGLLSDTKGGAYVSGLAMFEGASLTFDDLRLEGVGHMTADGLDDWMKPTAGEFKTLAVGPAGEFVTFGYGERPPETPAANALAHPGVTLWNPDGSRRWHHPIEELQALEPLAAAVKGDEVLVAALIPFGAPMTVGGVLLSRDVGDLALLRFDASGGLVQVSAYDSNAAGIPHDVTLHVVPSGVVLRSSLGFYELTLDAKERQRRRIGSRDGALAPGNHLVVVSGSTITRVSLKP